MALHRLVAGFTDAADAYERGRPGYPAAVIEALADAAGLAPGARVLDLGAGTGKLSRALAAAGFDVVAVDPLPAMRAVASRELGADRVLDGTAEAIPLPDASVDAVVVADAFHWFDTPRALPEIRRVLRDDGALVLLANVPGWPDPAPDWAIELGRLLDELRPEHPAFTGDAYAALDADPAFGPREHHTAAHDHLTDREGIVANVASISYVGGLPDAERAAVLARVDELLARHGVGEVAAPVTVGISVARAA
jgi:SAM-dependent methyltransferase